MVGVLLWVAFLATLACWVRWVGAPMTRQLAARLARYVEEAREAAVRHRATCPYLPEPGAKVIARGGWCERCRITHDQRNDIRRPAANCPGRPRRGERLAGLGDCPFCGFAHYLRDGVSGHFPPVEPVIVGPMRCVNLAAYVHGGVCGSCGVPHERPRPPPTPVPGPGRRILR